MLLLQGEHWCLRSTSCSPRAVGRARLPCSGEENALPTEQRQDRGLRSRPGAPLSCEREGQEQRERLSFCRVASRGQQRSGTPLSHTTWDCRVWRVSISLKSAPWGPHLPLPSPSSVLRGSILPEGAFLLLCMKHLCSPGLLC